MGKRKVDLRDSLDAAVEGYLAYGDLEDGIYPISQPDADIAYMMVEIIKKLGGDKELLKILENYKNIKDDDTFDLLRTYFDSMPEQLKNVKLLLNIGDDVTINIAAIYSFTKQETYENGRRLYQIVVNKTQDLKVPYANTTVSFATEDYRDTEFNNIKEKLRQFSNIMFI